MDKAFLQAKPILSVLKKNGYEAYFVGGAVRDAVMGHNIHDVDIATSARPEVVQSLFPTVIPVGLEHGTVIVRKNKQSYEVTTFRQEGEYKDHRRPSAVTFIASLEDDLKRRDFTMNAMAMTSDGKLIDPFSGKKDIERKMIRTVGSAFDRFQEDPLRILRALRFVAQLDFSLDQETELAINRLNAQLSHLSIERVKQEFEKLMLGTASGKALHLLAKNDLHKHLPCLSEQGAVLQQLQTLPLSHLTHPREMWALLLYKTCLHTASFAKAWRFSKKLQHQVEALLFSLHNQQLADWDPYRFYQLGLSLSESYIKLHTLIHNGDYRKKIARVRQRYEELPIKNKNQLAINGNDLVEMFAKKPGPWLGKLLHDIERAVVMGEVANEKMKLKEWARQWVNHCENNC